MTTGYRDRGPGVLPLEADQGGGYGDAPLTARDRILEPSAVGPAFYSPGQRAWLNNAHAWGYDDPHAPGMDLSLVDFDQTGAEYRDLVADGPGWRDVQPPGTGCLWRTNKV